MKKPSRRPRVPRRSAAARTAKTADFIRAVADAPVLLFELDPRGVITLLSGGLAQTLGLNPEDAVGRSVLEMHKHIPRALELIEQALSGNIFCTVVHIRGRVLEMCFAPHRDKAGRVTGVTGWATDATSRHHAEVALKESEQRYKAIFEGTNEGVLVADSQNRRFKYANPSICGLLGYSQDELLRLGVADIHPQDSLPQVFAAFEAQTRGELLVAEGLPCLRKDGSVFYADVKAAGVAIGDCFCTVGFFTDVTERKLNEAAQAFSEQKFSAAFETSPLPMAIAELATARIIAVNKAFSGWTGFAREEVVGRATKDLGIWPEPAERDRLEAEAKAEGSFRERPARIRLKSGEIRQTLFSASIFSVGGRDYLLTVTEDRTATLETERCLKEAHQLLKKSLRFTEALLSAIPTPVFYKDKEGRYLGCNRAFSDLIGVSPEDIKGKTVHELWPGEHAEVYHEKDLEVMRHPARQLYEFKVRDKDGKDRPVIYAKDVFRDENNQVAGIVGAFLDISERKAAEEKTGQTLSLLQATLESTGDGILVVDREMRVTSYNRTFLDLWGVPEELPASGDDAPLLRAVTEKNADPEQFLAKVRQLYAQPEAESFDTLHLKDGRIFERYSRPQRLEGKTVGRIWSFRDVTARKRAEESLVRSEASLRSIIESTPIGLLFYRLDGDRLIFTGANAAADHILNMDHRPMVGKTIAEVFPGLAKTELPRRYQAIARGGPAWHIESFEYHDRGISGTFMVDAFQTEPGCMAAAFMDVSERERLLRNEQDARVEAEAASKAKDDFLAIVSHELRTPLTAIMGWSWLLRSGKLAEEERQNALDIILRNMQSQRQIVEDLIDVSSLSRGMFSLNRKPIELGALLETDCAALEQLAKSRRVRLVRAAGGPVGVLADAGRLQQVCRNLLTNALKFTPEGGEVRVRLGQEGGQAVVEVQDSGRGIPPEFLPHVFDPFRQGEDPLTREHGGLGLGLAIVKRLVELHGGTVSAASAGQGRGSVFTVRLPAVPWPPPGQPEAAPAARPASLALDGLKILVVEDEADARQLLEQLLRRYGARVASAADAAEALASLEKDVPDLLLCDIAMPGEDGCSLLRKVRSRGGRLGAVPAAALSALAKEDDRRRALDAGFQVYLTKPADPVQILEAVRALVGRR
jgi:PAS domain S-box-containing protein